MCINTDQTLMRSCFPWFQFDCMLACAYFLIYRRKTTAPKQPVCPNALFSGLMDFLYRWDFGCSFKNNRACTAHTPAQHDGKKWKSIILIMPKQYQRDWPEVRRQKITRRNKNSSETKQTISLIGWRLDPFNSIPCSIFLATWSTLDKIKQLAKCP